MRILVVEDNDLVADAIVRGLAMAGFAVDRAASAESALAALAAEHFDLALLDIGLPGADDFLMKPFEQAELAARCRALIRRSNLNTSGQLNLGRMRIDVTGRQLQIDGAPVELTGREWLVLECLMQNVSRVVSKDRLQQAIVSWDQAVTPNAVEVYVSRLRTKLADAATIRAVRGLGYRLELEEITAGHPGSRGTRARAPEA